MKRFSKEYFQTLPQRVVSKSVGLMRASMRVTHLLVNGVRLTLLPGCRFARYAIPVDYPPSRLSEIRYGNSHPPIEPLMKWFHEKTPEFHEFLKFMRTALASPIPLQDHPEIGVKPAWVGGPITAFDTLALYSMLVKYRPKTFLEIGSGMTTRFARQAITDHRLETRLVSLDPMPRYQIDTICDEVIRQSLEEADLSIFDQLTSGDILFFDGSHRTFTNSDVTVFFIDVLPRLKPGVIVHLHDIHLPWDYPDMFLDWYWNEQYMLAVYLMNAKSRIDVLLPTAFIGRSGEFDRELDVPFVDLGAHNDSWRGGGSMWFTHTS